MMSRNSKIHILLVGGATPLGHSLQGSLQAAGFVVDVTHDEHEAGIQLQRCASDLVLVDARLVEASGFAVCSALRSCREAPIIVLSSSKEPEEMLAAYLAGADAYIVTPFSLREVTACIQRLVPSVWSALTDKGTKTPP